MKIRKVKNLKKELNDIHESLIEEKKRYSVKNKEKIKNNSIELYNFFLVEEKKMKQSYDSKIKGGMKK